MIEYKAYLKQNKDGGWDVAISRSNGYVSQEFIVEGSFFMKPLAVVALGITKDGIEKGYAETMIANRNKLN